MAKSKGSVPATGKKDGCKGRRYRGGPFVNVSAARLRESAGQFHQANVVRRSFIAQGLEGEGVCKAEELI